MALERTLSIIKPDAVAKNVIGEIYTRFERAGFKIVEAKMVQLDDVLAGGFYAEHKERPFYKDLVAFMTSGPVVVSVLEGEGANLWVLQTLKKRLLVLYVQITQHLSMLMLFTVLILLNLQLVKLLTSSVSN